MCVPFRSIPFRSCMTDDAASHTMKVTRQNLKEHDISLFSESLLVDRGRQTRVDGTLPATLGIIVDPGNPSRIPYGESHVYGSVIH